MLPTSAVFVRRWMGCTCLAMALSASAPAAERGDWAGWGGPNGDFSVSGAPLAEQWSESGPRQIWAIELPGGYSAISVKDGVAYLLGRDGDTEIVRAVDAATGNTVWEYTYEAKVPQIELTEEERNTPATQRGGKEGEYIADFGYGPNSTPLVLEDRVITIGYMGHMHCLDRTGKVLWRHDLINEFEMNFLRFGYSSSPILYRDTVITIVGGKDKHAVVGFDPKDGRSRWYGGEAGAGYASPVIMPIGGRDVLLCHLYGTLVAMNPVTCEEYWSTPYENSAGNNISTPILAGDQMAYMGTHAKGDRSVMFRFAWDGDRLKGEQVWESKFGTTHQNAVRMGDKLISTRARGAGVMALDLKTGELAWQDRVFGASNFVRAGEYLIALGHDGKLRLTRLKSEEGIQVLAEAQVLEDPAWTPPTLVGTTLYVRDRKKAVALDLGKAPAQR
jgi:outer membrane protein assembly factor BamB